MMLTPEQANAHACGDCFTNCEHPDHLWDLVPDLNWLMFGEILGPDMLESLIQVVDQGFVQL